MTKSKTMETVRERTPAFAERFGFTDFWKAFGFEETMMKVEEYRQDGTVVVRAELPGIDPDKDVEVTVEDGALHIHVQRTQSKEHEDASHYRSEFTYGSFSRTFRLPAGATEDDVKAIYKDGILEVRVPVDEGKAAARKVPVTAT